MTQIIDRWRYIDINFKCNSNFFLNFTTQVFIVLSFFFILLNSPFASLSYVRNFIITAAPDNKVRRSEWKFESKGGNIPIPSTFFLLTNQIV